MLSSGFYDFSRESGIKESLFADMQSVYAQSMRQAAPSREAVSLEDLTGSLIQSPKTAPVKPHGQPLPEKEFGKR